MRGKGSARFAELLFLRKKKGFFVLGKKGKTAAKENSVEGANEGKRGREENNTD